MDYQSTIAEAARSLGVVEQPLLTGVRAQRLGKLKGADSKVVRAEQMAISRLRAELERVKMERDILGEHWQRYETRRLARDEVIDWLLLYDRARLHSTLTDVSPITFEQDWLTNQPRQAYA